MAMSIRAFQGRENKPTETPQQSAKEAPSAQRVAGDVLVKLRQSFGEVATKLGRIEHETKTATEALGAAKSASESELSKMRRSKGIDAAPTQRLAQVNTEIPKREEQIANSKTELESLKLILPPQIGQAREALAEADKPDRMEFYDHLRQALQVLKRIEGRAVKFEGLTTRYSALVENYKFVGLDQYFYANTSKPPYTGAPMWRTEFVRWRSQYPALEEAPGRKWLDSIKGLIGMVEKLRG